MKKTQDFPLYNFEDLINNVVNPVREKSNDILIEYLRLHVAYNYYEYAVGSVQSQESALEVGLPDAVIVSCAVSAYFFMWTCLRSFGSAVTRYSDRKVRLISGKNKKWEKRIEHIRDRVAHPEEDKTRDQKELFTLSKRSSISSNGLVRIRQINVKEPTKSEVLDLTPREDLERLKKYLEEKSKAVKQVFKEAYSLPINNVS